MLFKVTYTSIHAFFDEKEFKVTSHNSGIDYKLNISKTKKEDNNGYKYVVIANFEIGIDFDSFLNKYFISSEDLDLNRLILNDESVQKKLHEIKMNLEHFMNIPDNVTPQIRSKLTPLKRI